MRAKVSTARPLSSSSSSLVVSVPHTARAAGVCSACCNAHRHPHTAAAAAAATIASPPSAANPCLLSPSTSIFLPACVPCATAGSGEPSPAVPSAGGDDSMPSHTSGNGRWQWYHGGGQNTVYKGRDALLGGPLFVAPAVVVAGVTGAAKPVSRTKTCQRTREREKWSTLA